MKVNRLDTLPVEVLVMIADYLGPLDLARFVKASTLLRASAKEGSWLPLHVVLPCHKEVEELAREVSPVSITSRCCLHLSKRIRDRVSGHFRFSQFRLERIRELVLLGNNFEWELSEDYLAAFDFFIKNIPCSKLEKLAMLMDSQLESVSLIEKLHKFTNLNTVIVQCGVVQRAYQPDCQIFT